MQLIASRKLITEGHKHDEAMDQAPWNYKEPDPPAGSVDIHGNECRCDDSDDTLDPPESVKCPLHEHVAEWVALPNARGLIWLRNNLKVLLDGYAEALREVERLTAAVCESELQHLDNVRVMSGVVLTLAPLARLLGEDPGEGIDTAASAVERGALRLQSTLL